MLDWLLGWAGLILGFSGLIFIHELGHFLLAKWNGVRVYVFSLGMGPYLLSFTWRGTVYALSMIPIGGYVKMMGQDDMNANLASSKDKSDYRNKRPGQKAAILAAGATFNLIFTIIVFALCYRVGLEMEPPRIGTIIPGTPLSKAKIWKDGKTDIDANLQKGDLIIKVNDTYVKNLTEVQLQIAGVPANEDIFLKVERHPSSGNWMDVVVKTRHEKSIDASGIGVRPYFYKMNLPLGFTTEDKVLVDDFEPHPEMKDKPAYQAGLRTDDEIIRVEDRTRPEGKDETVIRDQEDLVMATPRAEGRPVTFIVKRDGAEKEIVITPVKNPDTDSWMVGLPSIVRRRVSEIDENSAAFKAGLRKGDYVLGFLPKEPNAEVWESGTLKWKKSANDKNIIDAQLTVPAEGNLVFTQERQASYTYKLDSIGEAISIGWDDTLRHSGSVFSVIGGLIRGNIGKGALSGPIGIGNMIFRVSRSQNFLNFLWFLGFISLNLGVLQFVPIPLLDGFHLLMVGIEKLKGSPVAPAIQEKFQYVGLFIVGSLLLLATYNDIRRMFL